jgi:hypothetical protein
MCAGSASWLVDKDDHALEIGDAVASFVQDATMINDDAMSHCSDAISDPSLASRVLRSYCIL